MKKIAIFDFDGTLANTFPISSKILKEVVKDYGYGKISDDTVQKLRDMSPLQIILHFKFPIWKIPELLNRVREKVYDHVEYIKPFYGIKEMLDSLWKKNIKLGILTSNSKKIVDVFLKHKKFPKFEFIESELNIFKKPRHLKKTISKYKFNKEDVIYIGDEIRDIEAAHFAGVDVAAVTWGYNKKHILQKNNPIFLADKPEALLKFLLD
ncbi:MAG: HAD-IA family hydrolase [bacterium]